MITGPDAGAISRCPWYTESTLVQQPHRPQPCVNIALDSRVANVRLQTLTRRYGGGSGTSAYSQKPTLLVVGNFPQDWSTPIAEAITKRSVTDLR